MGFKGVCNSKYVSKAVVINSLHQKEPTNGIALLQRELSIPFITCIANIEGHF